MCPLLIQLYFLSFFGDFYNSSLLFKLIFLSLQNIHTRSYFYVKTRSTYYYYYYYYYYYNYYCSNYYYTTTPRLYPSKCLTTLIRTTLAYGPTPATAAATARPTSTIQLQNGRLSKIKWVQTTCAMCI